jgi:hypothetical protein
MPRRTVARDPFAEEPRLQGAGDTGRFRFFPRRDLQEEGAETAAGKLTVCRPRVEPGHGGVGHEEDPRPARRRRDQVRKLRHHPGADIDPVGPVGRGDELHVDNRHGAWKCLCRLLK